jgi:hypothetical protein
MRAAMGLWGRQRARLVALGAHIMSPCPCPCDELSESVHHTAPGHEREVAATPFSLESVWGTTVR